MSQVIVVDPVTVQTPVTNNCCPAGDLNSTHQHGVGVDRPITDVSLFARGPYLLVRSYQWLFAGRISPCRFEPSCSTYALESFEVHGLIRGSFLSLRRLARCHPWGGHGWDPVPRKKAA